MKKASHFLSILLDPNGRIVGERAKPHVGRHVPLSPFFLFLVINSIRVATKRASYDVLYLVMGDEQILCRQLRIGKFVIF